MLMETVGIDTLLLNVLIILAVIVAGALIVYLIWEAVTSFISKNKSGKTDEINLNSKKKDDSVEDFDLDQPVQEMVAESEEVVEPVEVDEVKAEEEQQELESAQEKEERENAERRAYLEARRQELIRRMQEEMEEDQETEEVEEQAETVEIPEETEVEEEIVEEPVVEEVAQPVVDEDLERQKAELAQEKARYETMVRELEEAKRALAEQKPETIINTVVETVIPASLSLDELKERLALAEDRLKATEKEYKQVKKEYLPLRRIWNIHERDEKKLRRKEAIVARQKVLLYGVNNYSDIDEEKAKKLAEELDLLDGLKLSVQHCEEVMSENKDRYPLLEKMYNVLKERDEEIKNDIETYKERIAKLEAEEQENASENSSEE